MCACVYVVLWSRDCACHCRVVNQTGSVGRIWIKFQPVGCCRVTSEFCPTISICCSLLPIHWFYLGSVPVLISSAVPYHTPLLTAFLTWSFCLFLVLWYSRSISRQQTDAPFSLYTLLLAKHNSVFVHLTTRISWGGKKIQFWF